MHQQHFFRSWRWLAIILLEVMIASQSLWAQATNRINFNNQSLFLNGANFAWRNFATDVGPGTTDLAYFSSVFTQVRGSGGNCMRLWLHTTGANTPAWTGTGPTATVTGPGPGTITDMQAILDRAWSNKVSVVLCLWSFDMLRTANGASITDRARNILTNDAAMGTYVTNAIIPMVQALKNHPAILAWEIFNEPEGMSLELGWPDIVSQRVPMVSIQKFINRCAGAIHDADPKAKVTNGSWSFISQTDVGGNFNYYTDSRLIAAGARTNGTLDFYCVHYYDWAGTTLSPFHNPYSYWGLTKPLVVAEFYPNIAEGCTNCGNAAYGTLYTNGYAGALAWSWTDSTPAVMLAQMAALSNAHPADVLIVIATNAPPNVTLTTPTNNSVFATATTIAFAANATDADGSVTNVEFFQGATKLGEDNTAPYQYNWTNPPAAVYSLTARATDNGGLITTSAPVNITVGSPPTTLRYEAETAVRTGTISLGSNAGASAGQYLYMQGDGTITWTVTNSLGAGTYNLSIGYFLPTSFGAKTQTLRINGGTGTSVVFNLPENVWQAKTVAVVLNAGVNTIAIEKDWGYMYFDYIELPIGGSPPMNTSPIFASAPTNRTIPELTLLTVTNNATDNDLPAQTLTYQLLNPPTNALISAQGVITWMPAEAQGPCTNQIITVVSDGTVNVTNSFQVIVTEVNLAPQFSVSPTNRSLPELTLLTVTNSATDADLPAQTVTYQLLSPPAGATINAQGVISWTPDTTQGPSTNQLITVAGDGTASVTNSFQVIVIDVPMAPVQIVSLNWSATTGFQFLFDVPTGVPYAVEAADSLDAWTNLFSGSGQAGLETFTDTNTSSHTQRFYRLRF